MLRVLAKGLIGLVALILIVALVLNFRSTQRLNRTYDIRVPVAQIPSDDASLARGEYLANALCAECHGADFSGEVMVEESGIATVYAPNLTPTEGALADFSDEDYLRAIRHGVSPEGTAYMIMPSEVFIHWSEEDLTSTIAYLKTLPPRGEAVPDRDISIVGGTLLALGMFGDIFAAEYIDHEAPLPARPEIGANADYGEYLTRAMACTMCHRDGLTGGPAPRNIPEIGEVPNITHAAHWSTADFVTTLNTGVKPDGAQLDPERMPWDMYSNFDSVEIEAIHAYVRTLGNS